MRSRVLFAFMTYLVIAPAALNAESLELQSSAARVSLLELYTSEGCSSCPPADRWLSNLKDDPRLWQEVVPVAFHVDYWDYIGWPDRFASPDYSLRQKSHARSGRVASVYTPGFVLAGEEWRSWFFRPVLKVASDEHVGPLTLELDDDRVRARFQPASLPHRDLELHVVVLGFDLETDIKAGENQGKTLKHDFVVLGHTRVAMRPHQDGFITKAALPQARFESESKAVAAWISATGDPYPIQATGGWLAMP